MTHFLGDNERRVPYWRFDRWRRGTVVTDVAAASHRINRLDLIRTRLVPGDDGAPWAVVDVGDARDRWGPRHVRPVVVAGEEAQHLLRAALTVINRRTGRDATVADAFRLVDRTDRASLVHRLATRGHAVRPVAELLERASPSSGGRPGLAARMHSSEDPLRRGRDVDDHVLLTLAPAERLALEMVVHEDDERRWLDGELHELERRWREAEEVAAIADRLLLPPSITARAAAMREGGAP